VLPVVDLPPEPSSAAAARRFTEGALGECPPEVVERAVLVVDELVTNVVLHARTAMHLDVAVVDEQVVVRVEDGSAALPVVRPHDPAATHGRGLQIVARIAREWGVETRADCKTVWCELDARSRSAAAD
jgi:anti-sigma regulatory factor (Ser/Thr protein kinase)